MTAVEASRRASRPVPRHTPRPKPLSLLCLRCDQPFSWPTITRECWDCTSASALLYGTAHPPMEISGW